MLIAMKTPMIRKSYLVGNLGPLGCLRCLGEEQKCRCQNKEEGNSEALKIRHAHEHQLILAVIAFYAVYKDENSFETRKSHGVLARTRPESRPANRPSSTLWPTIDAPPVSNHYGLQRSSPQSWCVFSNMPEIGYSC